MLTALTNQTTMSSYIEISCYFLVFEEAMRITATLTLTFNNSPNHDQQNFSNSLNTKKGGGDHDL
jgi:hypothetical protein